MIIPLMFPFFFLYWWAEGSGSIFFSLATAQHRDSLSLSPHDYFLFFLFLIVRPHGSDLAQRFDRIWLGIYILAPTYG